MFIVATYGVLLYSIGVLFINKEFRKIFKIKASGWLYFPLFCWAILLLLEHVFDIPSSALTSNPIACWAMVIFPTVFLLYNFKNAALLCFALGGLCNRVVIALNDGYMPVDQKVFERAFEHSGPLPPGCLFIDGNTRMAILGDWLYFPYAGGVFSLGDVLILLAGIIFVIQYRRWKRNQPL